MEGIEWLQIGRGSGNTFSLFNTHVHRFMAFKNSSFIKKRQSPRIRPIHPLHMFSTPSFKDRARTFLKLRTWENLNGVLDAHVPAVALWVLRFDYKNMSLHHIGLSESPLKVIRYFPLLVPCGTFSVGCGCWTDASIVMDFQFRLDFLVISLKVCHSVDHCIHRL